MFDGVVILQAGEPVSGGHESTFVSLVLLVESTMRLKRCWEWSHQPDRISCHRSTLTSRVKRLTCFYSGRECAGVVSGVVPRTATVWGRMTTRVIAQQKERWLKGTQHYGKEQNTLTVSLL